MARLVSSRIVSVVGAPSALDHLVALMARERGLVLPGVRDEQIRRLEIALGEGRGEGPLPARLPGEIYEALLSGRSSGQRTRRKRSGSFYTPEAVVELIVERTVAPVLGTRLARTSLGGGSPFEAVLSALKETRVCDPAMGTGFFLLCAMQVMERMAVEKLQRGGHRVDERARRAIRSTIALECLHGMDLDGRAARLARLGIWLQARDPALDRTRLRRHLGAGDALCARGWDGEDFDAVLGNPPYGARLSERARERVDRDYVTASGGYRNTALHFLERSHALTRPGGRLGLILPKSLAYSRGWWPGANLILGGLTEVLDARLAFPDVRLEQIVVIAVKGRARGRGYRTGRVQGARVVPGGRVDRDVSATASCLLVDPTPAEIEVFTSVRRSCRLMGDVSESFRGAGLQASRVHEGGVEAVDGRSIRRWGLAGSLGRYDPSSLGRTRLERLGLRPKILSQNIVAHVKTPTPHVLISSCMDTRGRLALDTVTCTVSTDGRTDPWLLLALLNATFISWWAYRFVFAGAVRTMHLDAPYVGKLPLPAADAHPRLQAELARLARALSRRVTELGVGRLDEMVCDLFAVRPSGEGYEVRRPSRG